MHKENKITKHTHLSQETCQRAVAGSCWGGLFDRWFSPNSVQDMMTIHPFHPWKALRRRWQWKNEQRLLLKTDRVSKRRGFREQKPGDENDRVRMSVLFKRQGQHFIFTKSGIMWQRTSRFVSKTTRILNYLRNTSSFSENFGNSMEPGKSSLCRDSLGLDRPGF